MARVVKTMSDPVSNVEAEDVLSSIRRLVSSDERPRSAEPPLVVSASARVDPERLVLTPSLRIDDAETGADVPETVVDGKNPHVSVTPDNDSGGDAALRAGAGTVPGDRELIAMNDPATAELKARIAELEEVVCRQSDQWEPDGALSDANAGGPVAPVPWDDDVQETGEGSDTGKDTDRDTKRDVSIAAPRVARKNQTDRAGDLPGDSSENLAAEDSAGADAPDEEGRRDFLAAHDGLLLDEDTLRDLVADIVRQELQGALGERITRNVRKLVRREIHRALASQDLS